MGRVCFDQSVVIWYFSLTQQPQPPITMTIDFVLHEKLFEENNLEILLNSLPSDE